MDRIQGQEVTHSHTGTNRRSLPIHDINPQKGYIAAGIKHMLSVSVTSIYLDTG